MGGLKDRITHGARSRDAEESPDSNNEKKLDGLKDQAGDRTQSVTDIFGLDGLTLYEKKCVLINREVDSMGMGKYQWCLWGLCGRL